MKMKEPKNALQILRRAPGGLTNTFESQKTLASAYHGNGESQKARDILIKYGEAYPDALEVHEKLREIFTEWKLDDLAVKEGEIILDIQKRGEETQNN
jgi:hypothetical protein